MLTVNKLWTEMAAEMAAEMAVHRAGNASIGQGREPWASQTNSAVRIARAQGQGSALVHPAARRPAGRAVPAVGDAVILLHPPLH